MTQLLIQSPQGHQYAASDDVVDHFDPSGMTASGHCLEYWVQLGLPEQYDYYVDDYVYDVYYDYDLA
jgi:hypothetical protein